MTFQLPGFWVAFGRRNSEEPWQVVNMPGIGPMLTIEERVLDKFETLARLRALTIEMEIKVVKFTTGEIVHEYDGREEQTASV